MKWFRLAFVIIACAVCLGAFGAHALKARLSPEALSAWQTGVLYLFIHSIALILTNIIQQSSNAFGPFYKWINTLLTVGMLLFCGSIFLLTTRELHGMRVTFLGPLTPVGGVCFIAAWLMAAFTYNTKKPI